MPGSAHRSVSFNLAGWLWADLLLGMFAIFLAANALAPSSEAAKPAGIDPTPIVMRIEVSGFALLGSDARGAATHLRPNPRAYVKNALKHVAKERAGDIATLRS